MFELANVARPGVSEYISGSGALSALDNRLEGFKTPLIVTGEKSYAAFTKFYKGNREFRVAKYVVLHLLRICNVLLMNMEKVLM